MPRTVFAIKSQLQTAIALACASVFAVATPSFAQTPSSIELDESFDADNISTRVEDLRLDEIAITSDGLGEPEYPRLREEVSYSTTTFEPVTIQLNDPDRLPQEQSSQFNLRLSVEDRD